MSRRIQYSFDNMMDDGCFDGTDTLCDVDETLCSKCIPCVSCPKFQDHQKQLDKDWDEALDREFELPERETE